MDVKVGLMTYIGIQRRHVSPANSASGCPTTAFLVGPLLSQASNKSLQRIRWRALAAVGEADLTLHIHIDRAHSDVARTARHAFGDDGDPDPGGDQRHRPVF